MMMVMITMMVMMLMMITMAMMESMMETSQLGSPNFPENYKVAMMLMITVMVVIMIMMMIAIAVMVIIKDFYFCLVAALYIITFAKQMRQKSKNIKTSWFIDATST